MNDNLEHISIEFHNRAHKIFFSIYQDFERASKNIDRKKEEYRFQQLRQKYVNTLHQQMEIISKDLLQKNQDHPQVKQLDQNLNHFTKNYQHEFIQKIRAD